MSPAIKESVNLADFEFLLDNTDGERDIAAYLKAHPWIAYWTLCPISGHARYALNEVPLGSEFKVDSVLLNSYSGVWEAFFVEYESVTDNAFTKRGVPTKCLTQAMKQCDDWAQFILENRDFVRRDLVRFAKRSDRLGYTGRGEPSNYSGDVLADPRSYLTLEYIVVIGRSSRMSADTRRLMGRVKTRHDIKVMSYDRLLQTAKARYGRDRSERDAAPIP